MRKAIYLLLGIVMAGGAKAQQIEEAKKFMYYERYKSAENTLHLVLKTDPANAEGWYWLSQAYLQLNQPARIPDTLAAAAAEVKNTPFYQVAYGHLLLTKGNKDSAQLFFEQALTKTKGKDPAILSAIAHAHITAKSGDASYAVQLLEKAIKRDKKNPALPAMLGDAYRKLGDGTEAYKAYQAAIDKNNRYAAALYRMGKIFVSQKNPEIYLNYFNQAIAADSLYAPALYELYYHYYFTVPQKALEYFQQYLAKSDFDTKNDYLYTDLLYLNKQYEPAIAKAQQLLATNADDTLPRLYKLMAYSYLELTDTSNAMLYMNRYFSKESDSNWVVKDFETMAELYAGMQGKEDSAIVYYQMAVEKSPDANTRFSWYQKLADLYKARKDYANQAKWLGKYYQDNAKATNIDLFNWGIAHFKAEEYQLADTVFGTYTQKYPEQGFGYYWRARTNSLMDSAMEKGTAIPYYHQLIEVLEKDTTNKTNKKWLVEAYGYLAAYETNEEKDYDEALEQLKKILVIDPENKDAQQYISILEKKVPDKKEASEDNR